MVALLLYGYCTGLFSSRKLESAIWNDVGFRVLAGGQQPHFTTINSFRKDFRKQLSRLFLQVLKLCQSAGLVKLGHVTLDGTNASKHKAMSYKRILKSELELSQETEELLKKAEETDSAEDRQLGLGIREEDLPEELRFREKRLEEIWAAKTRLEEEAALARARALRQQASENHERVKAPLSEKRRKSSLTRAKKALLNSKKLDPKAKDDDFDPPQTGSGLPLHEPKTSSDGSPKDKAQMNFTDPDGRIMSAGGNYIQGYSCQAAVDEEHQIIVAQAITLTSFQY